jgi:hypothetical protein
MNERRLNPVLLVSLSAFILLFAIAFPQSAYAQGIIYGDTIPAGQTVSMDLILAGEDVTIAGNVDGDVFAVGKNITISGDVSGSLVSLGGNIRQNGAVGGSVYSLALSYDMGPEASIGRSMHFIGLSVGMEKGASIGRDMVALSLGAQLAGSVNRDMKAIIGPLELFQFFTGIIGGEIDLLNLGSNQMPGAGSFAVPAGSSSLASTVTLLNRIAGGDGTIRTTVGDFAQSGVDWNAVLEWFIDRGREFVPLLLVGLLMVWLWSALVKEGSQKLISNPLPTIGYGLIGLVLALNVLAVVILLAILIFVVGLWLGVVSLWDFAFLFWGIGFTSIILAGSIFVTYVLFATKVLIAYLIGISILRPLWDKADQYIIVPFILGLLIYVLLVGIPILGFAIRIIVTGLGLGATWLYLLHRRNESPRKAARAKS